MTRADAPEKPPEPKRPKHSARTAAEKAAREARLAAEMRNNLKKRKARARAGRDEPG
jgi:hypothetical protein